MASGFQRARLGEILRGAGLLTDAQLSEGLREQSSADDERLGRCLLRLGHLSEEDLLASLSKQLELELIDVARWRVPPEVVRMLPADFVRRRHVLPLETRNGALVIATSEPGDEEVIEDIRLLTGLEVEERLATRRSIAEKIAESYDITVERLLESFNGSRPGETAGEGSRGSGDLASSDTLHEIEVMASEPTVINLVNLIISTALRERASDIHLVPFEKGVELRYRIDGVLHEMPPPPRRLHAALISRVKIMAEMNIAERFIPQDGHFQIQHAGRRVDVRVGTMPTIYGESTVLRLLEKDSRVLTLEELGLDRERCRTLDRLLEKPYGIFLATGPTGCGKTTTLYSVIHGIYSTERKILTLEDPVEYELAGVAQIPVKPSRGFTFATGLRAILRQDPDVIMVGEIRDSETAEIAIRAALTGHLVFSTLHTNDAAGAVARLLDMGIEAFLISSSLEAVIAQRLVRKICPSCKDEQAIGPELEQKLESLGASPASLGASRLFRGAGCDDCRQTGYRGRIGLFEILVLDPELREMILERRPSTEIRSAALRNMLTIRQTGLEKVAAGVTTVDEVLRVDMGEA